MKAIHNAMFDVSFNKFVVANLLKVKNESNSQQKKGYLYNRRSCGKSTKSKE